MLQFLCLIVLLSSVPLSSCHDSRGQTHGRLRDGVNGGIPCAACVFIVGLAEQLTEIYNESIAQSFDRLCGYLPGQELQDVCKILVDEFAPGIIRLIEQKETPEVACYGVKACKHQTAEVCRLFTPQAHKPFLTNPANRVKRAIQVAFAARNRSYKFPDLCKIPIIKQICDIIDRWGEDHLPADDLDGDYFSDLKTMRGTFWRGKDCDDLNKNIHPGRRTTDDSVFDTNCNGIYGIDTSTGHTYESQWCSHTPQMGIVIMGDSASAHFHIPPDYCTATRLSVETFQNLPMILEDEFDWPMLSAATGYMNDTLWKRDISGPMNSIYLKMRSINRCVHRDYQNLCVNGADTFEMKDNIMKSLARVADLDNPVFITLALLGNDVCNEYHDLSHMTTPEQFYQNQLEILQYLDSRVPPGSTVVAVGMVNGSVLYDALHDRIHPLGALRNDVTYTQLYDFLNCLQISPCFGWMNSNATWRSLTTERAMNLSRALKDLTENTTFKNFKVYYMDAPVDKVLEEWQQNGGEIWQLIEPVDGFHPNQHANDLTAKIFWDMLVQKYPEIIPPVNPFNNLIEERFGDQGGY